MENGTEMGAQECRNSLFLQYRLEPIDIPKLCNGCNTTFYIFHALDYKRDNLIMARHNDLCDEVADLDSKAFTPTHVRNNSLIFAGLHREEDNVKAGHIPNHTTNKYNRGHGI